MHTTEIGKTLFIHNGDYSGDVTIKVKKGDEIKIPLDDLLEFVGGYVRDQKISKLEQMSGKEVLRSIRLLVVE